MLIKKTFKNDNIVNRDFGTPCLTDTSSRTAMKTPSLLPTTKDILVCYSTLDGMQLSIIPIAINI